MKLRWHILFIALGVLAAILFAYTPRQPLWLLIDAGRMVRYAGCDPVRREWYCLSSTTEKTDWELETRVGMSPEVVRRVKLALPKLNGETQTLRISSDQPNKPWIVWDSRQPTSDRRANSLPRPSKTYIWLVNPITGELLKHAPLQNTSFGHTIASHGNKIAMVESGWVKLFDCQSFHERDFHVNYLPSTTPHDMIRFSTDGSLLLCLDSTRQSLIMIDWESTACTQQSLGFQIASLNFISPDVLLIHDGTNASRWKWNGKEFVRISPGIAVASNVVPVPYRRHRSGLLQLLASLRPEWPVPIQPWFEWLEAKGFRLASGIPKQNRDDGISSMSKTASCVSFMSLCLIPKSPFAINSL